MSISRTLRHAKELKREQVIADVDKGKYLGKRKVGEIPFLEINAVRVNGNFF